MVRLSAIPPSSSDLKNQKSSSDIYIMNADGSHAKAFTEDGKSSSAVWSKDGKSIFFTNYGEGDGYRSMA